MTVTMIINITKIINSDKEGEKRPSLTGKT